MVKTVVTLLGMIALVNSFLAGFLASSCPSSEICLDAMLALIHQNAFNTEGLSLDKFLEYQVANSGWVLEKGNGRSQLIALPRNEFNHPELRRNTADGIPLEHVSRIFGILV
ncbi:Eukaryotic translation initiation factor 3 subunit K [Platanthera guangdongensis]|uniref:Eukaryotic translation initiation factor 3 subunit K n=1 Tax=Platanthera guangdongensis TaxID=2320717 RepID=A0ABR2M860_9ASPA